MSMQKYKICPACGEHNPPSLFECAKCETDLTGVAAVDAAEESSETQPEKPEAPARLVRVCDCGAQNPPQARKCAVCGEDISDISPTLERDAEEEKKPVFALQEVGGEYVFEVTEEVTVLGREGKMGEYLAEKPYVSRTQAKLTIAAGDLFIEDMSRTNGTYLNNERIAEGAAVRLKDGDEIGLGGMVIRGERQEKAAYFTVCVRK